MTDSSEYVSMFGFLKSFKIVCKFLVLGFGIKLSISFAKSILICVLLFLILLIS